MGRIFLAYDEFGNRIELEVTKDCKVELMFTYSGTGLVAYAVRLNRRELLRMVDNLMTVLRKLYEGDEDDCT